MFLTCVLNFDGRVDDPIQRKGNHLEQRERLGLTSASKERPRTPPPELTNALQKVEVCW